MYIAVTMTRARSVLPDMSEDYKIKNQTTDGLKHELDVPARLNEFRSLKDTWLEGRSRAPSHTGLDWLSMAFDSQYPEDHPLPFLYPTEDGGVRAEWSVGSFHVSLDIDLETHAAFWHQLEMDTDKEFELQLNLDDADCWEQVARRIRAMEESGE